MQLQAACRYAFLLGVVNRRRRVTGGAPEPDPWNNDNAASLKLECIAKNNSVRVGAVEDAG